MKLNNIKIKMRNIAMKKPRKVNNNNAYPLKITKEEDWGGAGGERTANGKT